VIRGITKRSNIFLRIMKKQVNGKSKTKDVTELGLSGTPAPAGGGGGADRSIGSSKKPLGVS